MEVALHLVSALTTKEETPLQGRLKNAYVTWRLKRSTGRRVGQIVHCARG